MATHFDIDDHKADPMIADYMAAREQGIVTPLEIANNALLRADLALTIVTERGDDLDKAQAEAVIERVALAASACAKATRIGDDHFAVEFAKQANSEVLVLTSFDYVNVG
jgi:hypothetical protein